MLKTSKNITLVKGRVHYKKKSIKNYEILKDKVKGRNTGWQEEFHALKETNPLAGT